MSNLQQESSKRSRPRIRNESIEVNYKPRRSKGDGNLKKKNWRKLFKQDGGRKAAQTHTVSGVLCAICYTGETHVK